MATCAVIESGTGYLVATVDPVESCAGVVLLSTTEYADVVSHPWAELTSADISDLCGAIALVWVTGWAFRQIARVIKSTDEGNENA